MQTSAPDPGLPAITPAWGWAPQAAAARRERELTPSLRVLFKRAGHSELQTACGGCLRPTGGARRSRQRRDHGGEARRVRVERIRGDARRGPAFGRGFDQRRLRLARRQTEPPGGRRAPSVRLRSRAIFLGFRLGDGGLSTGRRGDDLPWNPGALAARTDPHWRAHLGGPRSGRTGGRRLFHRLDAPGRAAAGQTELAGVRSPEYRLEPACRPLREWRRDAWPVRRGDRDHSDAVSYTHLTLPTKRIV